MANSVTASKKMKLMYAQSSYFSNMVINFLMLKTLPLSIHRYQSYGGEVKGKAYIIKTNITLSFLLNLTVCFFEYNFGERFQKLRFATRVFDRNS